jgi:NTE family protein
VIQFVIILLTLIFLPLSSFAAEQDAVEIQATTSATKSRPKIGLALGGGGTRGVAHIGVLRVLQAQHIPIDFVAGTSMGAIVGGFYCAGVPLDRIQKVLEDKQLLHAYYTVPISVRVAVIPLFLLPRIFGYHPYDGLYRGNKFAHFVEKELPPGTNNIEDLKIPFCAVTADLLEGKAFSVTKGNLSRAIQASSAVPVLRRPVPIDNKLLVDGGIEANLPVRQVKEMGADLVIAVDVDEEFNERRRDFRKILSVGNRVASMILHKIDEEQVHMADIVIRPDVNRITLLSEKTSDGEKAVEAGELAATEAMPEIRARLLRAGLVLKD